MTGIAVHRHPRRVIAATPVHPRRTETGMRAAIVHPRPRGHHQDHRRAMTIITAGIMTANTMTGIIEIVEKRIATMQVSLFKY